MPGNALDEDAIDDILYLARVNETTELEQYLSELSTQTKQSKADLVAAAIDPYSKNSALHYGAANGHSDVIKLLLSCNLDKATTAAPEVLNAVNDAGNTPLHWAALNGHLECVKLLVELGADVTIINGAGHDAVFEAEINDKKDVVDWLLGAVEELEKGVGQAENATGHNGEEDMDEGLATTSNAAETSGHANATDVDMATEQMERLETNGPSQGG